MAEAPTISSARPVAGQPDTAPAGTAPAAARRAADVRDGPAPKPWLPPAFTDVELGQEVTAYAGRW
ncbi:pyrroloquinoline quinone precursor peptide PqqA [Streptomyces sp. NPDC002537]